jgi:ubiquinone/menaquinone biosynthesis C-methylase UbiE
VKQLDSQWLDIPDDRFERFEDMFRWNEATAHYYDGAALGPGHRVADFGCGPGHQAVEFARMVAPVGHVHALDINAEFIKRTRTRADAAGVGDRVSVHLLDSEKLPMPNSSIDRVVVRNTLIHVPDPAACMAEFRRVLVPGGLAHMIEGDRRLMAVESLSIGRRLQGLARNAGFAAIEVRVLTEPDAEGRLLGMIRTIAEYAREGGMNPERVASIVANVDAGLADGTYLAVSPQFVVTARV